ncbi:SDR family oxidoreductase [Streptomyces gardneri]|nr:SDR family oxidoreductase [Streptomyces gardneri]
MHDEILPIVPDGMLTDKVLIITGASQGIGEVAAFGFARAGARVVLAARRGEIIEGHARKIRDNGGSALAVATDVADEEAVKNMVDAAEKEFGRVDGIFNNAGLEQAARMPFDALEIDELQKLWDVKIKGMFLGTKHVANAIRRHGNGGAVVNNGTLVANRAPSVYPGATISQGAVPALTRSAAVNYGAENIRVNCIETGLVVTREKTVRYGGENDRIRDQNPMQRGGHAEEIAQVAAFLLSDYSTFVNGASIPVDGGSSAGYVFKV